ncbi:peptidoglycan-binding domain-containing protein [Luteibacter sahnii]|uniref:peptidoglycan-binding domain-containing protein n=1 Tax=Luteibacter sahnii TaxID=3021977 RepID=UPI002A6B2115|nr:peptidoglycan-binding domain-containing protein [Luteibacter sp. PPL193]MDY1548008.1 peptidoglycan-binding domain-containing protein [Luteibacter sp. PPL193]
MDTVSNQDIKRLVATQGTNRMYELEDGSWLKASEGTVAWRNNNPGNLKFGYKDSADTTVHTSRTKAAALASAQKNYDGVVDLDQWGNAVFKNYESGRAAQEQLLTEKWSDKTVEDVVKAYSVADYSGSTHHANQIKTIHATAAAEGVDLHGKRIGNMTSKELDALADGLSKAEGWRAGTVQTMKPLSAEALRDTMGKAEAVSHASGHALKQGANSPDVRHVQESMKALGFTGSNGKPLEADGRFGPQTKEAVQAFQRAHHLNDDGIVGKDTLKAIQEAAKVDKTPSASHTPLLNDRAHPAHGMYEQALAGMQDFERRMGHASGPHTHNVSGALTAAAVRAGLDRIDHVAVSDDASKAYAMQGDVSSPFKRHAEVDVAHAARTPLAESSTQAMAHEAQHAQAAQGTTQTQQQASAQATVAPTQPVLPGHP